MIVSNTFSSALWLLVIVLLVIGLVQIVFLRKKIKTLLHTTKNNDLESYLEDIVSENKNIVQQQKQIKDIYSEIREISQKSLQKVSLVRFNPFKDTGGDQSFVLCILDHKDTGIIMTAIHSRDGTRVYTKEITHGDSRLSLSVEEQKALAEALKRR